MELQALFGSLPEQFCAHEQLFGFHNYRLRMNCIANQLDFPLLDSVTILDFQNLYEKNISRISQLTEKASAFAFTPLRGYVMIALMITIGITLRNSSFPKYYLAIPYTAMGGCLLFGSVKFFREFFSFRSQENK